MFSSFRLMARSRDSRDSGSRPGKRAQVGSTPFVCDAQHCSAFIFVWQTERGSALWSQYQSRHSTSSAEPLKQRLLNDFCGCHNVAGSARAQFDRSSAAQLEVGAVNEQ
jgi:hypothetical protein